MPWLLPALVVYALIMLLGGVGAYFGAGSKPSLISGLVSGMLLLGAAAWAKTNPKMGFGFATLIVVVLTGVFIERSMKTHKMMSYGLLAMTALMLALLIAGHFLDRRAGS